MGIAEELSPKNDESPVSPGDNRNPKLEFVDDLRSLTVTSQVAQKPRGFAINGRTTRHAGYAVSRKERKQVEEIFGWMKTVASE
ncbi:hypothetical protein HP555_10370 [Desulfobulbus oligotrophicus]|uniref:Transposase DDE domain-containing protein n=1 Tax=Desulfobulbus oligotrophicus TaxID=1909699 RepID=A0A7T5VEE3_9BACT|nr:hypothetical protein HP555_10370 [Desulfobulbus oligotrophicus]